MATNQVTTTQNQPTQALSTLMRSPGVASKIKDVLGNEKVAAGFISSVISVANGNAMLRKADPMTIIGSAMVAATLQLPIVPAIGLAYIVPFKDRSSNKVVAQFQISYKGLIDLAERSGQFRNIIDEVVYEGQLVKKNKFTGEYIFDEDGKTSDKVIGYMARIDLVNGFSKTIYWSKEDVDRHAMRFSESFRNGRFSPWKSDYDAMARKTVLKALISKYAPKAITSAIQDAIRFDQGVVKAEMDESGDVVIDLMDSATEVEYIDNPDQPTQDAEAADKGNEAAQKVAQAMAQATGKTPVADETTGEIK